MNIELKKSANACVETLSLMMFIGGGGFMLMGTVAFFVHWIYGTPLLLFGLIMLSISFKYYWTGKGRLQVYNMISKEGEIK